MSSKSTGSKMAAAAGQARLRATDLGERIAPAVGDARDRIVPVVNDAYDRVGPAASDARDRLAPLVADARDRGASLVEEARDRLAPLVEDARDRAKDRLNDLGETVATALDERLPDDRTPALVSKHSSKSGGAWKKVLLALGLGAVVAVVAKRLRGGGSEDWQSAPGRPTPVPSPSATAAGVASAEAASPAATDHDVAGGTPDEAVSDAVETAHPITTPDEPAEQVEVKD